MVESLWDQLASRLVGALGAQRGELVEVRDEAGNQRLLHAVLSALESIGAEPFVQIMPAQHVERLLATTPADTLAERDRRRATWLAEVDRSLALIGAQPALHQFPPAAVSAFQAASARLAIIRQEQQIPQLLAAIPAIGKAAQLGISHEELELRMMPALLLDPTELQTLADRLLPLIDSAATLTISSGPDATLQLQRATQPWQCDTGRIDPQRAPISYLPAGSLTASIIPTSVEGDLFLAVAGPARAAHLHFHAGQITRVSAMYGESELQALCARFAGEPPSTVQLSIGLNPRLTQPLGWPMVDRHSQGALTISLLTPDSHHLDFTLTTASLRVDDRIVIEQGRLAPA